MLIGVFKSNQKLVNLITILITVILWLPTFFIDLTVDFPLLISTHIKWLDIFISIILIAGQSIYLNIIVNENKLTKENSHLTSLMLLLFNSFCLYVLNLNQIVIANTFILLAFHQLLRMYNLKNNYAILFNASFLIALASLIYFPVIIYFFLLWVTLIYTTTPKWRDFIISFIGFCIPIIYFIVYKFVFESFSEINITDYLTPVFDVHWNDFTPFLQLFFIVLTTIFFMAFINLMSTISKSVVRVRKMLIVVLLMFALGLGTLLLNNFDYLASFLIVSIPLAIIVANFFQNLKKMWVAEFIFLFLLGGVILSYFS